MKRLNRFRLGRQEGSVLVELALMTPLFLLLTVAAVDFGRAYFLAIEVAGAAHAAAAYGSQNPTDATGAHNAAKDDAPDVSNLTISSQTYGCECADGSSYSSGCTTTPSSCPNGMNVVNRVSITVTATYSPLFRWPAGPLWPGFSPTILLVSSASMRSS